MMACPEMSMKTTGRIRVTTAAGPPSRASRPAWSRPWSAKAAVTPSTPRTTRPGPPARDHPILASRR